MTDYSKLSDFEINSAVSMVVRSQAENPESKYVVINDFCNNPADAWPIIVSKKICIAFDVFAEPDDGGGWVASPAYYIEGERIRHDNPLRAAMIVFLMMQDATHANS
ncbi:phage protein NinX family protein [Atlantibacter hermannii]|uniref:phage protein NinX family protein n=1 Tax=Atlantibacter hermannii TaxID=565 RepID=UPI0028029169|nr:phage protein NinX family protein [Atlantibacter hermannii]MDQ7883700.1 DUF2591 family protein [Atlantibacter hermannii]